MAKSTDLTFARDLRYRFEYLGLRFLIGLVRLLPIDIAASVTKPYSLRPSSITQLT